MLYVVDAILIIGLAYLCCCPYKKYDFDHFHKMDDDDDNNNYNNNNYLSFEKQDETDTFV